MDIEGETRSELMPIGNSDNESPESGVFPLATARLELEVGTDAGLDNLSVEVINLTFVTREGLLSSVWGIKRRLRESPSFTEGRRSSRDDSRPFCNETQLRGLRKWTRSIDAVLSEAQEELKLTMHA